MIAFRIRMMVLIGLIAAAASVAVAQQQPLKVPNATCDPDTTPSNACSALSVSCCDIAVNPCGQYCSAYSSPSDCNQNPANMSNCFLTTNVSCGTFNSCATKKPIPDKNGADSKCNGEPDNCSILAPGGT